MIEIDKYMESLKYLSPFHFCFHSAAPAQSLYRLLIGQDSDNLENRFIMLELMEKRSKIFLPCFIRLARVDLAALFTEEKSLCSSLRNCGTASKTEGCKYSGRRIRILSSVRYWLAYHDLQGH